MGDNKPFLTYDQQIERLIDRGMIISDRNAARLSLQQIGFYRLGFYWFEMRNQETKRFYEKSNFSDVLAVYSYEIKLKALIFHALTDIEIYFRNAISYQLGKYGAYDFHTALNFRKNIDHKEWLNKYARDLGQSSERFLQKYGKIDLPYRLIKKNPDKYQEKPLPKLPIWTATQIMSFGTLAYLYESIGRQDQYEISQFFGVRYQIITSWLKSLSELRNIIAHHGFIWDRKSKFIPKLPDKGIISEFDDLLNSSPHEHEFRYKLYCQICVIAYLMLRINANSTWRSEMATLLSNFPTSPHIKISGMGVANNWQSQGFWRKIA